MDAPWTVASWVRMKLLPKSNRACSLMLSLVSPIWSTGTVEAEKMATSGGVVPGGRPRSMV